MTTLRSLAAAAFMIALAACAPATQDKADPSDPLESWNRGVFAFNQGLDTVLIKPVSEGYRYITPKPVRTGVYNFFQNLREPVTFANQVLQGNSQGAFTSFWRFVLNSTIGLGGLIDVADESMGLKKHKEDFGQTLGAWGWTDSDYIVLPILGPSTTRDTLGFVGDIFTQPSTYYLSTRDAIYFHGAEGLSMRESVLDLTDDIDENSIDKYATYRSLYLQHRAAEIQNRKSNAGGVPSDVSADDLK